VTTINVTASFVLVSVVVVLLPTIFISCRDPNQQFKQVAYLLCLTRNPHSSNVGKSQIFFNNGSLWKFNRTYF